MSNFAKSFRFQEPRHYTLTKNITSSAKKVKMFHVNGNFIFVFNNAIQQIEGTKYDFLTRSLNSPSDVRILN